LLKPIKISTDIPTTNMITLRIKTLNNLF